jgi:hypothetical protein
MLRAWTGPSHTHYTSLTNFPHITSHTQSGTTQHAIHLMPSQLHATLLSHDHYASSYTYCDSYRLATRDDNDHTTGGGWRDGEKRRRESMNLREWCMLWVCVGSVVVWSVHWLTRDSLNTFTVTCYLALWWSLCKLLHILWLFSPCHSWWQWPPNRWWLERRWETKVRSRNLREWCMLWVCVASVL